MFGWITGRQKSNLPEPTAFQTQRSRQIEQLRAFNQNVSEIQRDVEYRVNTAVSGTTLSLYITLPPLFPQDKPIVKVSPRVSHHWVNDQMIITGSPGLNSFMIHSDLGKVIREVVEEFQRNPPTMLPQQYGFGSYSPYQPTLGGGSAPSVMPPTLPSTGGGGYGHPPPYPAASSVPNYMPQMSLPPTLGVSASSTLVSSFTTGSSASLTSVQAPHTFSAPSTNLSGALPSFMDSMPSFPTPHPGSYKMPSVPQTFPQLQDMTIQELQLLSEDEDQLVEILRSLPELQQITVDRQKFLEENEEMAKQNLSLKPEIEERKRILLENYQQLNELRTEFDDSSHRQETLRQQFDPRVIQDNLKVAVQQADETSETLAEQFLDGHVTAEEFKKQYMERRKLSHLRKAKEERLGNWIATQEYKRNF